MPFTFSHPAIVLPLAVLPRRRFSATGLIAGSMAPDFEYFLRMKVHSAYSHTLWGLAAFDLPLGILMAFVFHELVKPSLIPNLPGYLQVRYSPFAGFSWRRYFTGYWPVVCYSVLLGAASHVLWDSFTHEHGYFVENWQALTGMVTWGSMEVPVYKVLQHGSTLAGALMILLFIHKLPAGNQSTQSTDFRYWCVVTGITATIVGVRLLMGLQVTAYGNLVVTFIAALLAALILTPLVLRGINMGDRKAAGEGGR